MAPINGFNNGGGGKINLKNSFGTGNHHIPAGNRVSNAAKKTESMEVDAAKLLAAYGLSSGMPSDGSFGIPKFNSHSDFKGDGNGYTTEAYRGSQKFEAMTGQNLADGKLSLSSSHNNFQFMLNNDGKILYQGHVVGNVDDLNNINTLGDLKNKGLEFWKNVDEARTNNAKKIGSQVENAAINAYKTTTEDQ